MDARLRGYIAETVGVFLIVFLGGAAVCASILNPREQTQRDFDPDSGVLTTVQIVREPRVGLWGIALAEGCALAVVLPIVFRESQGCLNPAVTLALWVCKRLETRQMGILIGLQLLGSVVAGLALRAIFPENAIRLATPHVGEPLFGEGMMLIPSSLATGILIEGLVTFALTFGIFGLMIDPRGSSFGGVGVGALRCAIVLAAYHLTGAAANPARWFGPFVWQFT